MQKGQGIALALQSDGHHHRQPAQGHQNRHQPCPPAPLAPEAHPNRGRQHHAGGSGSRRQPTEQPDGEAAHAPGRGRGTAQQGGKGEAREQKIEGFGIGNRKKDRHGVQAGQQHHVPGDGSSQVALTEPMQDQ